MSLSIIKYWTNTLILFNKKTKDNHYKEMYAESIPVEKSVHVNWNCVNSDTSVSHINSNPVYVK